MIEITIGSNLGLVDPVFSSLNVSLLGSQFELNVFTYSFGMNCMCFGIRFREKFQLSSSILSIF